MTTPFLRVGRFEAVPGRPETSGFCWAALATRGGAVVKRVGPVLGAGTFAGCKDGTTPGSFTLTADTGLAMACAPLATGHRATIDITLPAWSCTATFDCPAPPILNGPGGCAPCILGMGTLYASIPQCTGSATMSSDGPGLGKGAPTPGREPFVSSGIGWWDHQMQGTLPEGRVARLLLDASGAEAGLQNVRYVWFTAHLPGVQLMISWILDVDEPLRPGTPFLFKNASTVALYHGPGL